MKNRPHKFIYMISFDSDPQMATRKSNKILSRCELESWKVLAGVWEPGQGLSPDLSMKLNCDKYLCENSPTSETNNFSKV